MATNFETAINELTLDGLKLELGEDQKYHVAVMYGDAERRQFTELTIDRGPGVLLSRLVAAMQDLQREVDTLKKRSREKVGA